MPKVRVCDVALDPRHSGSDAVWTYKADEGLRVGDAVVAPLGTRSELGFVIKVYEAGEGDLEFPLKALRGITSKIDGLSLPAQVVDVAKYVADEYLCPPAVALAPAEPPGVRNRLVTTWTLKPNAIIPSDLTALQLEVVRTMRDSGGAVVQDKNKKLQPPTVRALKLLATKGLVEKSLRVSMGTERRKGDLLLRLTSDRSRVDAFLSKEGKKRPAQALTLMQLQATDRGALSGAEIKALAGVTDATIKALLQSGLLESLDPETKDTSGAPPPKPNPAQQIAIDAVVASVRKKESHPFLLYGVTGSGKTEVYIRAAAEALRMGRQVLYVVPEIALAAQAIGLLRRRFGMGVALLHSSMPETERLENWLKIRSGEVSIVLGARSALFAPLENLGLVIVDEEHEQAYKQESAPRYHAKNVALRLGLLHKCPVILGSATPSIESFYEAEIGEQLAAEHLVESPVRQPLTLLTLPKRAAAATMPAVTIHDLGEGYRSHHPQILSDELKERMQATLCKRQQVILFLNRRAYAPFLICRDCGQPMECPNCSVSLSFHRRDKRLRCHHCGYQIVPPEVCPKCNGVRLAPFGAGTEKVEEAVMLEFPDATVGRLDRDIAKKKGVLEETLAAFRSGEISILVGTQIVAKGLDFPNVTLVGVIAADVSLNIPDFRASERTFQLLSQVAGRAGRGASPGTVVIQTFNPNHPSVVASMNHEYLPFFETLIQERKEAHYPPFSRLVNVLLAGEDQNAVIEATLQADAILRTACPSAQVLGPVDCAVERSFGKWRRHVLVKLPAYASAGAVGGALQAFEPVGVQVTIDVDPYSMM